MIKEGQKAMQRKVTGQEREYKPRSGRKPYRPRKLTREESSSAAKRYNQEADYKDACSEWFMKHNGWSWMSN